MLELTMASLSGAPDTGATAGMQLTDAADDPGTVLRIGRDQGLCVLVAPQDWLFVSRAHLEFRCGPGGGWTVTWLRGSRPEPSSETRVESQGEVRPLAYGETWALPPATAGELVVQDRSGPRSIHVGYYLESGTGGTGGTGRPGGPGGTGGAGGAG
ncbi:hypothetical protein [Streptomyces tsukubensis]|uniref:FHA domain-containing protein n=1 Tax=Streptomyces tsukubensis TaxID=83656 RepID=A0A1V4A6T2_9ACTN|nr:hypothetical protein [Streptomyces tsukubensis]OON76696.1 hypothetical protein B1H18_20480 [Streptomyces tsukubensis]